MRFCLLLFLNIFFLGYLQAQNYEGDYYWHPSKGGPMHANHHFKIKSGNKFEYAITRPNWLGSSYVFGDIIRKGEHYMLQCKTDSFPVRVKSCLNDTLGQDILLIHPVQYLDASSANDAYVIFDDDSLNKQFINPYIGLVTKAGFKKMRIQVLDKYCTQAVAADSITGNELKVIISLPYELDNLVHEMNGDYFTILNEKEIELFNGRGESIYTMVKD
ncbi:hypothetical protein [Filimonas effusa]|uniref:Gliding motility-associated protein GldM C-terminal domain-containing protein n=1 Tax=Filimonas effusa TaxID=2508721 RepID=A0A4Q1DCE9_9BACT|nr:hypothetical protein [Filimonas effusa]RXK86515.1 hypothetical protein ESB13_06830 [Filimonas effusa]